VYYGGRGKSYRGKRGIEKGKLKIEKGGMPRLLTFVAVGALLGIKSIGSDREHVIALDADAVNYRTYDCSGLDGFGHATRRRSGRFFRDALGGHERILA
jgi:hypothetical protein